ncbi:MAG TPA: SagB/ThcOx family dehydrogenase [Candidatus Paceibacterota bacterium]|nr:SagB/ThcOx family dehydrogenase [Candidatus Paceibacterota bacterium]
MNGDFAKRFHQQSTAEWRRSGLPAEKDWPEEWSRASFKAYPRAPRIPLADPLLVNAPLGEILSARHTSRSFHRQATLSFEEISTIIRSSAGIRGEDRTAEKSKRVYPSGGRRYPLEIYLCAERVSGLERGIYHFNVKDDALELIGDGAASPEFAGAIGYEWAKDASAFVLITGVWDRTLEKYRDFGHRFVFIEAGHLTQNLQLVSESLGLAYASLAGFRESKLDSLLMLEPSQETSLYLTAFGRATAASRETA